MQKRIRVEGSAEKEMHNFIVKPINMICSLRTFGNNTTHTHKLCRHVGLEHQCMVKHPR